MTTHRLASAVSAAAFSIGLTAGAANSVRVPAANAVSTLLVSVPTTTSQKYAPGTYRQRAERITVYVDGYPASLHTKDPYIPLRVAIMGEGKGEAVRIDAESFTLIDQYEHAYPMAPYVAFTEAYKKRIFDESLFRERPMALDSRFATHDRLESRFFPAPGRGTRITRVDLPPYRWVQDVIYFKRPASLGGVLTLRISGRGLPEPVEVRFRILENG